MKNIIELLKNNSFPQSTIKSILSLLNKKEIMPIVPPVSIKKLLKDFEHAILLNETSDGKNIYLVNYKHSHNVMREVFRLREITFRLVGEGTGKSMDYDKYDKHYDHIVLWDKNENEIVGSYRLGNTKNILEKYGIEGLYTSQHFTFHEEFKEILPYSIELGRSFIQSKYWKSNALDYLWRGISGYIKIHPNIKYLWGEVSISDKYSEFAKNIITSYYKKWYCGTKKYCTPITEFITNEDMVTDVQAILCTDNREQDFENMKTYLTSSGFSVPILYKRYTDLTTYGNSLFYAFSVDHDFNDCIDGLIVLDMTGLQPKYLNRYFK